MGDVKKAQQQQQRPILDSLHRDLKQLEKDAREAAVAADNLEDDVEKNGYVDADCSAQAGTVGDAFQDTVGCNLVEGFSRSSPFSFTQYMDQNMDSAGNRMHWSLGTAYTTQRFSTQLELGRIALPVTGNQPTSNLVDWTMQFKPKDGLEFHSGLARTFDGTTTEGNLGGTDQLISNDRRTVVAGMELQSVTGVNSAPLGAPFKTVAFVTDTENIRPDLSVTGTLQGNVGMGNGAYRIAQFNLGFTKTNGHFSYGATCGNTGGPLDTAYDPGVAKFGCGPQGGYTFENGLTLGANFYHSPSLGNEVAVTFSIPTHRLFGKKAAPSGN